MAARVTAFVVFAIVAVTFVAGLIVGAQRADDSGPVDLIVYNARVYTGNPDDQFAEAIAVRGNRILRVGSNREIKRLMRRATTVIDAHGGSVTAGFHDGRVDLMSAGRSLAAASALASDAGSAHASTPATGSPAAGTTSSIAAGAGSISAGTPAHANAPGDSASAGSPGAGSSGAGSTPTPAVALAAGATAAGATAVPPATSTIPASDGRVTAAGDPRVAVGTAAVASGAATAVGPAVAASIADPLALLRAAMTGVNRAGITSVEVTARQPDELAPYDTLLRNRELTARVSAALAVDWPLDAAALERLNETRRRYQRVPLFKVDAIRLQVSDGLIDPTPVAMGVGTTGVVSGRATAGSRGAAAGAAASSRTASGSATRHAAAAAARLELRRSDLGRTITQLGAQGWQIILQTEDAGDAGLAVSAIEAINLQPVDHNRRIRLELGAPIDDDTVARLGRLGVIASLPQPRAATPGGLRIGGAPASGVLGTTTVGTASAASWTSPRSTTLAGTTRGADATLQVADRGLRSDLTAQAAATGDDETDATGTNASASARATTGGADAMDAEENGATASARAGNVANDATGASGTTAGGPATKGAGAAASLDAASGEGADASLAAGSLGAADKVVEAWAYDNLLASTAPFMFYSGWPDNPLDPRFALSMLVLDGLLALTKESDEPIGETSTLSMRLTRAIDAYTRHPAFASADNDRKGTIAKEMLADLVIFSTDLFALTPDKVMDADVTTTIFDGKVVYRRPADAATVPPTEQ